jgi:hypothetical protein
MVVLAVTAGCRILGQDVEPEPAAATVNATATAPALAQGFLYGRITTIGGAHYAGRLRFGGDQEAFWGDYFNGAKKKNPWAAHAPLDRLPRERHPITLFGMELSARERPVDLGRLFMARFGDIARIDAGFRDVKVTLKSGASFVLDRFEASDFDDGVRVWDDRHGVKDLDTLRIRTIELLPTDPLGDAPQRLHGTVRTRRGDFTGFVQWNRQECVGSDVLDGQTTGGEAGLRFDTIRSIARRDRDSVLVTLQDGGEVTFTGRANRGIYVDDKRYGRVLVSWDAFERIDFSPAGSGPAYGDFPPGRPLTGSVTTRDGRRLDGRLVYDLDESETTETFDAPSKGVDYTIPFGLVASIVPRGRDQGGTLHSKVTLQSGEVLQLERSGDLDESNVGLLVFVEGRERPEYVAWADADEIAFDPQTAIYPALAGH